MKTPQIKKSDSSSSGSSSSKPFIPKSGEGGILSESNDTAQPFISPSPIKAELTVGEPDDKYEQEADEIAQKVVENNETRSSDVSIQQNKSNNQSIHSKSEGQKITPTNQSGGSYIQRSLKEEGRPGHRFVLSFGDNGPGVSLLQFRLNALGFEVPVTAQFDRATVGALRRFHTGELMGVMSATSVGQVTREAQLGREVDFNTWSIIDNFTSGDTGSGVSNGQIRNSGQGQLGHQLGFNRALVYAGNGVEISFELATNIGSRYNQLQPRQWLGPEAQYVKSRGNPDWERTDLNTPESGSDDPAPGFWQKLNNSIVFYDSPGPQLGDVLTRHPDFSEVRVIQNFTCWVDGRDVRTGNVLRLSEAFAWHSVIDIRRSSSGEISMGSENESGSGWRNSDIPS